LRGVTSGGNLEVGGSSPVNNIAIFTSAASANLLIGGGAGHNSIYVDTCYAARFISVTSTESDGNYVPQPPEPPPYNIDATVTVARCQTPQILVKTGLAAPNYIGGNDTVYIYGNNMVGPPIQGALPGQRPAYVLDVETGDGNDTVSASYNVIRGDAFITLGQIDDTLTLAGNLVMQAAIADGGAGGNRLNSFGNQFGATAFTNFH
jgi:hypothetical protein